MSTVNDMIKESVNRMFSQQVGKEVLDQVEAGVWPGELWQLVEESGFSQMLSTGSGDVEDGWQNAYPVFHASGFYRLPLPLAETIIANALLGLAGLAPQDGPMTLAQQDSRLTLRVEGDCLVLNGAVASVPWARFVKRMVIVGRVGTQRVLGLVETAARGLRILPAENIAGEPRDRVSFHNTRCSEYAGWGEDLPDAPVTLFCALARAAMMVGAVQSVLQQSVEYANDRVQFGKPIGTYQAIQQALAIVAGEVACARTATLAACQAATLIPSVFDVAVAKIRAGQAAGVAANIAHQVHGAFGFTHEHTLHYATRRLWSWRAEYGAESIWAADLGRQAIEHGGDKFWSALVTRQP
ncbi:MAG: acyl-CoA dehydrogenase [Betaproteobacteria bacterium]|nr:MAG: acyl-CoA dehydrogenase [Betaproteobacteria bacterium]